MSTNNLEFEEYVAIPAGIRRMNRSRCGRAGAALMALLAATPAARAVDEKPPDAPAEKKEVTVSAGPDGFLIQSGSDYRLRIGGYAQVDGRFYAHDRDGAAANTFLLRSARLIFQGNGKLFCCGHVR